MNDMLLQLVGPIAELVGSTANELTDNGWKVPLAEALDDISKDVGLIKWKNIRCQVAPSKELVKHHDAIQQHLDGFDSLFKLANASQSAREVFKTVDNFGLFKVAVYVLGACVVTQSMQKRLKENQTREQVMLGATKWWADSGFTIPSALEAVMKRNCS